ncbi:AVAST type 2 anti-phage system protein Avs2 [Aeromonas veronii]|uniref:AVAST type 2 anti-phage system protein Avs2 n=1 Tax=Aeromonas veronii TaxID=654 RepID=UPI003F742217
MSAIALYVATKLIDQFISEEGYGWLKRIFIHKQKYVDRLYLLIEETAMEFELSHPAEKDKIPFYQTRFLFEKLNDYFLSKSLPNKNDLLEEFNKHPNVTPPSKEDIDDFYSILSSKINNCAELKKLHIEDNYKEKIFDIGDALVELKLLVKSLDNKLSFTLNKNWLNEKCTNAIADLGGRYTPKLNLRLEISNIFEGAGRTETLSSQAYNKIDQFLIKGNKLNSFTEIDHEVSTIKLNLNKIRKQYCKINFNSIEPIPTEVFIKFISNCQSAIYESESKLWKLKNEFKDESNSKIDYKISSTLRALNDFSYECSELIDFFESITIRLANNPFLLLEGEAGIGKSHLLADVITTRINSNYSSLFILGQQLTSDESPWVQIFKRLQLNITSSEFLEKINLYGQHSGKRVLIFIDAINEGNGNNFWEDNINSFIGEIRKYKWIGLILSIRTTYKNITIKDEQITRNNLEVYKHFGFKDVELDAQNLFYENYGIEKPSSPNLNPEFKNPLFLKLFCEGIKKSGLNTIPKGYHGISKILNFFVEGVNKSLSSPKKYNFDPSLTLVSDSLDELIKVKLSTGKNYILLKTAFKAVNFVVSDYITDKNFLSDLVNEGLLTKGLIHNDDGSTTDIVYISFERFDDHLTVKYMLDKVKDINAEFQAGGGLIGYFKDENSIYFNKGLAEALSIQLPEKYNKELYELLPDYRDHSELIYAFLDSLIWRNSNSIDIDKLRLYINECVIKHYKSDFLEMLISISGVEDHPFNANYLHTQLLKYTLPERDLFWTTELKYKYSDDSSFKHLIDWAWSPADKSHVSDSAIELVSTAICWLLTSTNRTLRDCATKALVNLLQYRIGVITKIINKFHDVNDPYVLERVFAVALGCILRTREHQDTPELAKSVYMNVFDKKSVFPHILLRDYAREIIEYVHFLGISIDGLNVEKTKPPYDSVWPEVIPTKEELQRLYNNDEYSLLWSSIMGAGDFSRYIIGTNYNYSDWSGCKLGQEPVNRRLIYSEFMADLSTEQLSLFKSISPFIYDSNAEEITCSNTVINIGRIVARKSEEDILSSKLHFKKSLSPQRLYFYENEIEPYIDNNHNFIDVDNNFDLRLAERYILNRVIELGWSPDKHGKFDSIIGTGRGRRESYQERIGKKYQWIAYHEFMAKLADNFIRYDGYGIYHKERSYIGPWDPYIRDIDPTILLESTGFKSLKPEDEWWSSKQAFQWDCTFDEWVGGESILSEPYELICVKDTSGEEWLILESYPTWKEPKIIGHEDWGYPRKQVWCHIKSYLVKSTEYEHFKSWAMNQHYMGRWMPEGSDRYELFNREYYWSVAFSSFNDNGIENWVEVTDRDTNIKVADVAITSISYLWGEEFDHSKKEALKFLKPSFLIYHKMNMKHGVEEGSYIDEKGNVICFSAEALNNTQAHLLVKKEPFVRMLKDCHLNVVWTLLGEKDILSSSLSPHHQYARTEFSGAFYLNEDAVKGKYKTYKH